MNIPLIQKPETNDINASLIAIKKAEQQLNSLIEEAENKITTADEKIAQLNDLIANLNLATVGGSGKLIQSISQDKGQVSATVVDITDTISANNNLPASSQGVAQRSLFGSNNTLNTAGWYRIATVDRRNQADSLIICLSSYYNNTLSGSHIIMLNYAYADYCNVSDFARDTAPVFDKIKICTTSSNTGAKAIYVHYVPNASNGVAVNIFGCVRETANSVYAENFEQDTTTWAREHEFKLGRNGFYVNEETALRNKWDRKVGSSTSRPEIFEIICTGMMRIEFTKYITATGEKVESGSCYLDGSNNVVIASETTSNVSIAYNSATSAFRIICTMTAEETKLILGVILTGGVTKFQYI